MLICTAWAFVDSNTGLVGALRIWFIPIINLFKPYQVAAEINEYGGPKGFHRSTPQVGLWWGCWLIGNFLTNMENRMALSGASLGGGELVLSWASSLLTCAAGFLFIQMIFSFAKSQETLIEEVE